MRPLGRLSHCSRLPLAWLWAHGFRFLWVLDATSTCPLVMGRKSRKASTSGADSRTNAFGSSFVGSAASSVGMADDRDSGLEVDDAHGKADAIVQKGQAEG